MHSTPENNTTVPNRTPVWITVSLGILSALSALYLVASIFFGVLVLVPAALAGYLSATLFLSAACLGWYALLALLTRHYRTPYAEIPRYFWGFVAMGVLANVWLTVPFIHFRTHSPISYFTELLPLSPTVTCFLLFYKIKRYNRTA